MNKPSIGRELLDVPMGEMIRDMAFAIAEAQMRLDENSIDVAEMMGGLKTITDTDAQGNETVRFEDSRVFFGTEKIPTLDAIEIHNSSRDAALRSQIRTQLGSNILITTAGRTAITDYLHPTAPNTPRKPVASAFGTDLAAQKLKTIYHDSELWIVVERPANTGFVEESPESTWVISLKANVTPPATLSIPRRLSMLELGFTPTFYQFVDTIIEVKIAIKYTMEAESSFGISTNTQSTVRERNQSLKLGGRVANYSRSNGKTVSTTQVNAQYSQKFSYSAEGSSLIRTKLVPIPPPAILEERIRLLMEQEMGS
jgi:hypothetical protein